MAADPRALLEDPQLLAIAPLVLAAWDDAFLTPAELLAIRDALERASETAHCGSVLRAWLDPNAPPTVRELSALRAALSTPGSRRAWASTAPAAALRGLHSLLGLRRPAAQAAEPAPGARHGEPAPGRLGPDDIARLRRMLDGAERAVRDEVRTLLQDERFRVKRETETTADRAQVLEFCRHLSQLSVLQPGYADDPRRALYGFAAAFETLAYFDLSVTVKFGVQFGLFANALQQLGSAPHHELLPAIRRAEILGCFAMTERGHGSNVRDLQTRADYDADKHEFVIHTPSLAAGKEWIGGAAQHARMAVVFAQLHVAGEACGVHALLVPIRDVNGALLPGIRAEDCGHKMGLNGVDNGRLWFEHVRVPHSALLDRFGRIGSDGRYESPIPSPSKRFFSMLGTLIGGRVNVAGAALSASKLGLAIALTYATRRRQFPDAAGVEQPLIAYLTHRLRLLPALAEAYAFSFAQQALLRRITDSQDDAAQRRRAEALASGFKAIATWRALDSLQQCRECCGGQGYLTSNRLDALRTDADVFTTFEGDNSVLCQQLVKELLREQMTPRERRSTRELALRDTTPQPLPIAPVEKAEDALADAHFQQRLFALREQILLSTLTERIERRLEAGIDPQTAFEACQDHVLAVARAHVERFVLDTFQAAAAHEPLLTELSALYALGRLQADAGWFFEHDQLKPADARRLRNLQHALLEQVAPRALDYIEAFGIPRHCLGPLADPAYLESSGLASESPPTAPR